MAAKASYNADRSPCSGSAADGPALRLASWLSALQDNPARNYISRKRCPVPTLERYLSSLETRRYGSSLTRHPTGFHAEQTEAVPRTIPAWSPAWFSNAAAELASSSPVTAEAEYTTTSAAPPRQLVYDSSRDFIPSSSPSPVEDGPLLTHTGESAESSIDLNDLRDRRRLPLQESGFLERHDEQTIVPYLDYRLFGRVVERPMARHQHKEKLTFSATIILTDAEGQHLKIPSVAGNIRDHRDETKCIPKEVVKASVRKLQREHKFASGIHLERIAHPTLGQGHKIYVTQHFNFHANQHAAFDWRDEWTYRPHKLNNAIWQYDDPNTNGGNDEDVNGQTQVNGNVQQQHGPVVNGLSTGHGQQQPGPASGGHHHHLLNSNVSQPGPSTNALSNLLTQQTTRPMLNGLPNGHAQQQPGLTSNGYASTNDHNQHQPRPGMSMNGFNNGQDQQRPEQDAHEANDNDTNPNPTYAIFW